MLGELVYVILEISIGFKQEEFYWQNASLNIFKVGFVVVR